MKRNTHNKSPPSFFYFQKKQFVNKNKFCSKKTEKSLKIKSLNYERYNAINRFGST